MGERFHATVRCSGDNVTQIDDAIDLGLRQCERKAGRKVQLVQVSLTAHSDNGYGGYQYIYVVVIAE